MKRLSRHTVVVLLVALLSSAGGLTVAVVAFGQSGGDPDATVPAGDYTGTTPSTPLSPYATTPATTPTSTTPATTPTNPTTTTLTTTNGKPERKHGTTSVPDRHGTLPSRVTRKGPTHLAFTGGEPLYVGFFGAALMAGGLMLHRRRRAATDR